MLLLQIYEIILENIEKVKSLLVEIVRVGGEPGEGGGRPVLLHQIYRRPVHLCLVHLLLLLLLHTRHCIPCSTCHTLHWHLHTVCCIPASKSHMQRALLHM